MARRTKEEAQETRELLLDAAERLFSERGVSRASLADIADAAGVTRGAIYWHFRNKADLFQAIIDRVVLPMEEMVRAAADDSAEDPLERVSAACVHLLRRTAEDEQARRVIGLAFFKREPDEELKSLEGRQRECRAEAMALFEKAFRNAVRQGQLPKGLDLRCATYGLMAYVDGLLYTWLMAPGNFDLGAQAGKLVRTYLSGLAAGDELSIRPSAKAAAPTRAEA
jgi:TetR/AcrR family transcriptional regulator, acrAB operon repressor